jgi:hypothetical protein
VSRLHEIVTAYKFVTLYNGEVRTRLLNREVVSAQNHLRIILTHATRDGRVAGQHITGRHVADASLPSNLPLPYTLHYNMTTRSRAPAWSQNVVASFKVRGSHLT